MEALFGCTAFIVLIMAIFFVTYIKAKSKSKVYLSKSFNFGRCPNCDASWYHVPYGFVAFPRVPSTGNIVKEENIVLCKWCLSNPDRLDVGKIVDNLADSTWNSQECSYAQTAMEEYIQSKLTKNISQ